MNDYTPYDIGQSLWHFGHPMLLVLAVPSFSESVRIRSVELRTVQGAGQFARPDAYLLEYSSDLYYKGEQLTYSLNPANVAGANREPLDSRQVQKLDNQLSVVIPVNIAEKGCHEAQVVFRVKTRDGTTHTLATRWYVTLDTAISKVTRDNDCAGPQPSG
jgi:hypothetical protein